MKKEHIHDWRTIAYFYAEGELDEWLVLECIYCKATKVIRGKNQRDEEINSEIL